LSILAHDLSGKTVDIHATLAKNINPVVSIQYSAIRPGFQTTRMAGKQGDQQGFAGKPSN